MQPATVVIYFCQKRHCNTRMRILLSFSPVQHDPGGRQGRLMAQAEAEMRYDTMLTARVIVDHSASL